MGKLGLQVSAKLENISSFQIGGPDFRYFIKTRCTNCGEKSDKWHYACLLESVEGKTGRSSVHYKSKCKACGGREVSLSILEDTIKPYVYDEEKEEKFQTIVVFECRGVDLCDFDFRTGWVAKAQNSSSLFDSVDFSDGDWADYDENVGESVGIYDLKHKFIKVK